MIEIEHLCASQDGLGEAPLWVEAEQALYWSDHVGPAVAADDPRRPALKRFNPRSKELTVWPMAEQIGAFGLRERGGFIAASNSGFCSIDFPDGHVKKIVDPEQDLPGNRFNDGKVDRQGRFWCGTMDTRVSAKSAHIYRLDADLTCRRMPADFAFVVSNGIAFDPEGKRMYFGDTKGGMIHTFDLDEAGTLSNQREFFSTAEWRPGLVDGATVDADGYYWFALVQGGKILRLDPTGRLDRVIDMPIPGPTCVTFGGDNYETLFVTSQRAFFTPERLAQYPQSGDVFAIHGLGVRGLPEPKFAG